MLEEIILIGTLTLAPISIGVGWYYQTKKIEQQYGPQIIANLEQTKEAIRNNNYGLAKELFKKRKALVTEADHILDGWTLFANSEILDSLQGSKKLEDALRVLE